MRSTARAEPHPKHRQLQTAEVAVLTSAFDWSGEDTTGVTGEMAGAWTVVPVLRGGEWKIVNAAEGFPPPGAM
ncbi:MAG: hypothetical protein GTN78_00550 [Gemmatimonadales bacterium]|nr:hypothetical protein [Gemmatimonadales bacterium]NIN10030.1 hypothetical protein [Gemmatimonadales bacterium]NIQ98682.1 hypothetical protein [Gemmatimonadales bacterium]NIS63559.1 hypothetical protein [Gemmatimonadales bacterium]